LYRAGVQKPPESFKVLLGRLHRTEERRNTILHSNWVKSPFCGLLTRYKNTAKSGKGFLQHTEDFEPEHIEAIVTETQLLADDLVAHFNDNFPTATTDKIFGALQLSQETVIKASIAKSEHSQVRDE
jgi:hypothetical protein